MASSSWGVELSECTSLPRLSFLELSVNKFGTLFDLLTAAFVLDGLEASTTLMVTGFVLGFTILLDTVEFNLLVSVAESISHKCGSALGLGGTCNLLHGRIALNENDSGG